MSISYWMLQPCAEIVQLWALENRSSRSATNSQETGCGVRKILSRQSSNVLLSKVEMSS
jgi:hypothetical protein